VAPHTVLFRVDPASFEQRRTSARLIGLLALAGLLLGLVPVIAGSAISAAAAPQSSIAAPSSCRTEADAGDCDVDHDRIPDVAEGVVCGDLTCADGSEDGDGDGIADWVEVSACDSAGCANPRSDADDDGIPDFAEVLTCSSATCSDSRENRDNDAATDWAEVVICGDPTCASGLEDYDSNGIADAAELQACVREVDDLAFTGFTIAWIAITVAIGLIAGGVVLRMRRSTRARTTVVAPQGEFSPDGWTNLEATRDLARPAATALGEQGRHHDDLTQREGIADDSDHDDTAR
jgi:hypothetical protein